MTRRKINLDNLQIFCDVVDLGSMSKAGKTNQVSQSTISRAIHSLEKEAGARLFEKSSNHVSLTRAGRILYQCAPEVLNGVDRMLCQIARTQTCEPIDLHLGTSVSIARALSPFIFESFIGKVRSLKAYSANTPQIEQWLDANKIDIAIICSTMPKISEAVSFFLYSEPYWIVLPKVWESRINGVQDLMQLSSQLHFVQFNDSAVDQQHARRLLRKWEIAKSSIDADSVETVLHLVEQGKCWSLLTPINIHASGIAFKNIAFKRFDDEQGRRGVWLVYKNDLYAGLARDLRNVVLSTLSNVIIPACENLHPGFGKTLKFD